MPNRLSHSQTSRYQNCGQSYKYYYVDKIRTTTSHAALNFGTAIDRATGQLLLPEGDKTAEEVFIEQWTTQEVNGTSQYLPTFVGIVYSKNDWDEELLNSEDWKKLLLDCGKDSETVLNLISKREEFGYDKLKTDEKETVNLAFWLCLKNKGLYMVKAFRKKVLPKLTKVLAVQKQINLENDQGDSVLGFVDLIATVEGHGTVVLDVKTSARAYDEETSVIFSPQLSLYVHALFEEYQTRKAGFIVLNKSIIKNRTKICSVCSFDGSGGRAKTCDQETVQRVVDKKGVSKEKLVRCNGTWNETLDPEVFVQFIIEEIPQATEDLVIDNISDINTAITRGVYTKNLANCLSNFGRPCEYIGLCYKGDMTNLEKK